MAITSSAKKAIRVAAHRRVFNLRRKDALLEAKKEVQRFVKLGKVAEARKALPGAYKAIDKAAKTKFIKKNAAARLKSRLTLLVNKVVAK